MKHNFQVEFITSSSRHVVEIKFSSFNRDDRCDDDLTEENSKCK